MKNKIYIVTDVSGSMNEMGKIYPLRNLCRYLSQLEIIKYENYSDIEICYFQWAQRVTEFKFLKNGDFPAFTAENASSLSVLSDFLSQNLKKRGRESVLILSDGHFSSSDVLSFHSLLDTFSDLIIRTVSIGADADMQKLKKISTNNSVYLSENIASAIDGLVFDNDEAIVAPISTKKILIAVHNEPEDWDA